MSTFTKVTIAVVVTVGYVLLLTGVAHLAAVPASPVQQEGAP